MPKPDTNFPSKLYSTLLLISTLVISISLSFVLAHIFFPLSAVSYTDPKTTPTPSPTPTPTPDPLAPFNILLMGYGGFEHDGGELTDTMLISHVRPRDNTITLISLPRDTWVPLHLNKESTQSAYFKINHAFALGNDDEWHPNKPDKYTGENGGITLAKETVEKVTGLQIKNTIAVSFYAFTNSIDTIGGVNVYVPVTFEDKFYPLKGEEDNNCEKDEEELKALEATLSGELLDQEFKCRYETLQFDSGPTQMDGVTALKFVRSRHSEEHGGDFGRSQRQQALVEAVKYKVMDIGFFPKIYPLITDFKNTLYTDITAKNISNYFGLLGDIKEYELYTINLNTLNVFKYDMSWDGQSILSPKGGIDQWEGIHSYLESELTAKVSTSSAVTQQ